MASLAGVRALALPEAASTTQKLHAVVEIPARRDQFPSSDQRVQ